MQFQECISLFYSVFLIYVCHFLWFRNVLIMIQFILKKDCLESARQKYKVIIVYNNKYRTFNKIYLIKKENI